LNGLADLPIKVPFHSIIGPLGPEVGPHSTDGLVEYYSAHLAGAESEKIIPAGHYLMDHPETVAEIKRILEENIARGKRNRGEATVASRPDSLRKKVVVNELSLPVEYFVTSRAGSQ
jgi:hypothetical protein